MRKLTYFFFTILLTISYQQRLLTSSVHEEAVLSFGSVLASSAPNAAQCAISSIGTIIAQLHILETLQQQETLDQEARKALADFYQTFHAYFIEVMRENRPQTIKWHKFETLINMLFHYTSPRQTQPFCYLLTATLLRSLACRGIGNISASEIEVITANLRSQLMQQLQQEMIDQSTLEFNEEDIIIIEKVLKHYLQQFQKTFWIRSRLVNYGKWIVGISLGSLAIVCLYKLCQILINTNTLIKDIQPAAKHMSTATATIEKMTTDTAPLIKKTVLTLANSSNHIDGIINQLNKQLDALTRILLPTAQHISTTVEMTENTLAKTLSCLPDIINNINNSMKRVPNIIQKIEHLANTSNILMIALKKAAGENNSWLKTIFGPLNMGQASKEYVDDLRNDKPNKEKKSE